MLTEKERPSPLEAVRPALAELGDAPHDELAAFVGRRFGLKIAPQFILVARASLQGLEQLEAARRAAQELVARALAHTEQRRCRPARKRGRLAGE